VLLVVVLAAVCLVGGVQVVQARDARARSDVQQARYADALAAARSEAQAFVNVSHEHAADDLARIGAGATGALKDRYTSSADSLVRALRRNRTVTEGDVLWAGVVRVDDAGATVLVATDGTRSDRTTNDKPVERDLRLRLRLVPVGGEWLTSDITMVD
jgi:Mce-associated membrane protein